MGNKCAGYTAGLTSENSKLVEITARNSPASRGRWLSRERRTALLSAFRSGASVETLRRRNPGLTRLDVEAGIRDEMEAIDRRTANLAEFVRSCSRRAA
jgi:hypothetical protein